MPQHLGEILGDLDRAPESLGDTYTWADLVEIRCLVHPDHIMSLEAIAKMADADVGHSLEAMTLLGTSADPDPAVAPPERDDDGAGDADVDGDETDADGEDGVADSVVGANGEDGAEDDDDDGGFGYITPAVDAKASRLRRLRSERIRSNIRPVRPTDAASPADRRHVVAADVIRVLEWRRERFGDDYPFEIRTEGLEGFALARRADLSDRHYLYLFLLACASLPLFEFKANESDFTYPFERLTALALRKLFPGADVRIFGTSDRHPDVPTGLRDRIQYLAALLNGEIGKDVKYISTSNTADGGLDVFAQLGLGDEQEGRFVVFGQAACTDEWTTKQDSASAQKWKNRLQLQVPQVSVCAIPMSYRRSGGDWHDMTKMSDALLLDRSRLMFLVSEGFSEIEDQISADGSSRRSLEAILSLRRS